MPRTARCKYVECYKTFDINQVRIVGDELMRLFLAVRLSKRIDCNDCICQKCRSHFPHWQQKVEGDLNKYDSYDQSDIEFVDDSNNSVWLHLFVFVVDGICQNLIGNEHGQ